LEVLLAKRRGGGCEKQLSGLCVCTSLNVLLTVETLSLQALQRLTEAAEKAKMELSSVSQTSISLPFITATADGPKHIEQNITRAKFEEMCSDLLDRYHPPPLPLPMFLLSRETKSSLRILICALWRCTTTDLCNQCGGLLFRQPVRKSAANSMFKYSGRKKDFCSWRTQVSHAHSSVVSARCFLSIVLEAATHIWCSPVTLNGQVPHPGGARSEGRQAGSERHERGHPCGRLHQNSGCPGPPPLPLCGCINILGAKR